MKKFWLVCQQEYKRHVLRKRFLFAILSMPLFVGLLAAVSFLSVWLQYNSAPIGYVDEHHILTSANIPAKKENGLFEPVTITQFKDEKSARAALEQKEIQAYFMLPENYMDTGEVSMVSLSKTGTNIQGNFGDFLTLNILSGKPPLIINRLTEGTNMIIRSADGKREIGVENWTFILLPIVAGLLFVIAVNISGGYLLQAVVEEKENRTMEVLITSVSPDQLMAGKIVGNLAVGLTELVIWIFFAIIAINILPKFIPMGEPPQIPASYILLLALTFLPAFVMIAAAMGAIGATATEMKEAQQVAGFFTIPIVIPYWFITAIMLNPNGNLAVGMSIFPLTSPLTLPMRAVFTDIPAWQLVLAISLLFALAIFSLWLAGRIFRLGMLRFGKKVKLKEAFKHGTENQHV
jgi:ABC-2 type transport system permease protein